MIDVKGEMRRDLERIPHLALECCDARAGQGTHSSLSEFVP